MGKYKKGDHVKIEVKDDKSPLGEWVWMLVESSDDEQQLVFFKFYCGRGSASRPHRRSVTLLSSRPSFLNGLRDFLSPPHRVRVWPPLLEAWSYEPLSIDCGNVREEL